MSSLDSRHLFVEHVLTTRALTRALNLLHESAGGAVPDAIFPEIRILTADKPTLNHTLYPEASLRGDRKRGTGQISFVRPYPIPVIRDHNTNGGGCGGESSPIYGRFMEMAGFAHDGQHGYLTGVPMLSDAEAIDGVMSGRWLTGSLGSRADGVTCSISTCNQELTEGLCEHERGRPYEITPEGAKKPRLEIARWRIGPIRAKEWSFVITPADDQAGVLVPNTQLESARPGSPGNPGNLGSGCLLRLLARTERGVFDLTRGVALSESQAPAWSLPEPVRKNFLFRGWRAERA